MFYFHDQWWVSNPAATKPSSSFYCSTITVADERQVLWDRIYRSLSTAVYNTLCQFDCAQRFRKRRRFAGVCAKTPTVCCLSASSGRGGGLVNWNSCSVAGRENNCPFLPLCSLLLPVSCGYFCPHLPLYRSLPLHIFVIWYAPARRKDARAPSRARTRLCVLRALLCARAHLTPLRRHRRATGANVCAVVERGF